MRQTIDLNDDWTFVEGFDAARLGRPLAGEPVRVPHTAVELPLTYFDERAYQKVFTYQRTLDWRPEFEGKALVLRFEGVMADARVYAGDTLAGSHADGYTPFEVPLTAHANGEPVLVTLRVDGSENPDIPPFGGRIDYLTYAGLYRDVTLLVLPRVHLERIGVIAPCPDASGASLSVAGSIATDASIATGGLAGRLAVRVFSPDDTLVAERGIAIDAPDFRVDFDGLSGIEPWDIDDPVLYRATVSLETSAGEDGVDTSFGFRTAEFRPDGFHLNGRPLKLLGLNRHQSFPYSGYAQGKASQERDADILKDELSCNVVRSSHYPPSPWFLDRCDRIGLLVLEEIPGWQHIGGAAWKEESIRNVRRMIERDRNHPCVISWGVRINESADDGAFYRRTNELARELDPTRATSGVRYHRNSELLEDVYTMNDFVQGSEALAGGQAPRIALRGARENTGLDRDVPYFVTEYNGHMFPTKVSDPEARQAEHALRHLNVIDAMFGDPTIAGCTGWCLFDYNTHKDFGAGDRVCHHGVMTIFREPKFAAHAYASQGDPRVRPVMQPVTYWARGERDIGGVLPLLVLTNLDEIGLRLGDEPEPIRFRPARARYSNLPHAPVIVEREDVSDDVFGRWGMDWPDVEFLGYLDGRVVATRRFVASPIATALEVVADRRELAAASHDEVRVIVRAVDQVGNVLPFLGDSVRIAVEGPARLIGPASVALAGGSAGFWLRSEGGAGRIEVCVSSERLPATTVSLEAIRYP